jgi:hypothetical protein
MSMHPRASDGGGNLSGGPRQTLPTARGAPPRHAEERRPHLLVKEMGLFARLVRLGRAELRPINFLTDVGQWLQTRARAQVRWKKVAHPFALSLLVCSRRSRFRGGLPYRGGGCFRRGLTLFELQMAIFESRGDVAIPPCFDTQRGASQVNPVNRTFLLCPIRTFSYCRDSCGHIVDKVKY